MKYFTSFPHFLIYCYSYEMMMQCWKMSPEDRPTFKELCTSVSKFIERIAGYLEIGFNPFTAAAGGVGSEENKGKFIRINNIN